MELASTLCSGESFEKALVLTYLGLTRNPSFYDRYEHIYVFYGDNMPKTTEGVNVHGALSTFINHRVGQRLVPDPTCVDWHNKAWVLRQLVSSGRITRKVAGEISHNRVAYSKVIPQIPWVEIFPELQKQLLKGMRLEFPQVSFVRMDLRKSLKEVLDFLPRNSTMGKVYAMDHEGRTSCLRIRPILSRSTMNRITHSVVVSGNVYVFIVALFASVDSLLSHPIVGYRHFTRFHRKAYDNAIEFLQRTGVGSVIEPRNIGFSEELDSFGRMPMERKTTEAVYEVLDALEEKWEVLNKL